MQRWLDYKVSKKSVWTKGHLISKANYGLPTTSKKRTDEFDLFAVKSKKVKLTDL